MEIEHFFFWTIRKAIMKNVIKSWRGGRLLFSNPVQGNTLKNNSNNIPYPLSQKFHIPINHFY